MREEGILPGDVVVLKQATARNGQTVVAMINEEATIKTFVRRPIRSNLHPGEGLM
jgi:repressor LexA